MFRVFCLMLAFSLSATAADWVTVKGQLVWPKGTAVPKPEPINLTTDKAPCLKNGVIDKDDIIINPKNSGLKNVWVYLRPDNANKAAVLELKDIKPQLQKPAPVTHVVDQPCCMFIPKILALRSGDFINFKNTSPLTHNVKVDADAPSPSFNKTLAPNTSYQDSLPFMAQNTQAEFSCSIHPWMKGKFRVFDHPYFALTDDDGKFEIKDAPAGKYRIVYHHDLGYHKGKEGRLGWPVEIKDGGKGTMELTPVEFVVPPQ